MMISPSSDSNHLITDQLYANHMTLLSSGDKGNTTFGLKQCQEDNIQLWHTVVSNGNEMSRLLTWPHDLLHCDILSICVLVLATHHY